MRAGLSPHAPLLIGISHEPNPASCLTAAESPTASRPGESLVDNMRGKRKLLHSAMSTMLDGVAAVHRNLHASQSRDFAKAKLVLASTTRASVSRTSSQARGQRSRDLR